MRKTLLSFLLVGLSTTASASSLFDFSRPAILNEVKAVIIESETADLVTVQVTGKVRNGAGQCESSFNRASLRLTEENEVVTIEARLRPVGNLGLVCDGSFDQNWNGSEVSKTYHLTPASFETAVVLGYPKKGESVSLKSLVK